jgi:hypothetical protein
VRARGWLAATRPERAILVVVLLAGAFPLGSAGAADDLGERIQRISQVIRGLQLPAPAVKQETSGGQLVVQAPQALGPGVAQAGLIVDVWATSGISSPAQGVFNNRATEILCQRENQAATCKKDPTVWAMDLGFKEGEQSLGKGELTTLRNGTKVGVAVTAGYPPPVLLLSKPGAPGRNPFPAAIAYGMATCGRIDVDVRTVPGQDHDALVRSIREAVGDLGFPVDVEVIMSGPPMETDPSLPVVQVALNTAAQISGQPKPAGVMPYITDASVYQRALRVPVMIFGPGDPQVAHQPDEWVAVPKYLDAIRFYTAFARAYLA